MHPPASQEKSPTQHDQLQAVLTRIISRLLKMLTRKGERTEEGNEIPYETDLDADLTLAPLQVAVCSGSQSENNGPVRPPSQNELPPVGPRSPRIESAPRSLVLSRPGKKAS